MTFFKPLSTMRYPQAKEFLEKEGKKNRETKRNIRLGDNGVSELSLLSYVAL